MREVPEAKFAAQWKEVRAGIERQLKQLQQTADKEHGGGSPVFCAQNPAFKHTGYTLGQSSARPFAEIRTGEWLSSYDLSRKLQGDVPSQTFKSTVLLHVLAPQKSGAERVMIISRIRAPI